jgi:hypothetical protein
MKKYIAFFLFACAAWAGSKVATDMAFDQIDVGATEAELKQKIGSPYAVKNLSNCEKEFEYIERVIIDDRMIEMRHYYFVIKDGMVASKRMVEDKMKGKRLLDRNAFDLQTSLNEKDKDKPKD